MTTVVSALTVASFIVAENYPEGILDSLCLLHIKDNKQIYELKTTKHLLTSVYISFPTCAALCKSMATLYPLVS
jgi:hypothetical protein